MSNKVRVLSMLCLNDSTLLTSGVGRLTLAQDHVLFETLHRIDISLIFLLDQVDFPEGAPSDHLDNLEVFNANVLRAIVWISLGEAGMCRLNRPRHVAIHVASWSRIVLYLETSFLGQLLLDAHWGLSKAVLASLSHFDYAFYFYSLCYINSLPLSIQISQSSLFDSFFH